VDVWITHWITAIHLTRDAIFHVGLCRGSEGG